MRHFSVDRRTASDRRGAVVVLAAFVLVLIVAMVAFAVDCGILVLARTELQRNADASSLAGSWEALEQSEATADPFNASVRASINAEAIAYLERHKVLGQTHSAQANPNNEAAGEVVLGVWNPSSKSFVAGVGDGVNALQVRANRTAGSNGEVPLFFARIFGLSTAPCRADAIAYFANGISGFKIPGDQSNVPILPLAIQETKWNELISGDSDDDDWSWNSETETVSAGADGIHEALLFPEKNGAPGNFGTVNIGTSSNSTDHLREQVSHGITPADLGFHGGSLDLGGDGQMPLSGDTGISTGTATALEEIVGQPRIIPIYRELSGTGTNAVYTIVGWGGVRIMEADMNGSNKSLVIQPATVVSKGVIEGGSGSKYVYARPRLVQ